MQGMDSVVLRLQCWICNSRSVTNDITCVTESMRLASYVYAYLFSLLRLVCTPMYVYGIVRVNG